MVCNFRAANEMPLPLTAGLRMAVCALLLAANVAPASAERADRNKQMVIEADQPGTVDLQRQVVVFNGRVVITQGTMQIRADRVELHEAPDGYRSATALGSPARQATYKEKRDGVDETVEGEADRIEYDGRTDTLHFIGDGAVRRYRAGVLADEINGARIAWDNLAELFRVEGGATTPSNPSGRVRAVLSPPSADASAPAADASAGAVLEPARRPGAGPR